MIADAGHYLSQNLDKRITIPQLACILCTSEKKLKAGFADVWRSGVHRYLTICRMEKVKKLLLSDQPLKAIACCTGYTDKNALIKAFRLQYGVSPMIWKQQQRTHPVLVYITTDDLQKIIHVKELLEKTTNTILHTAN